MRRRLCLAALAFVGLGPLGPVTAGAAPWLEIQRIGGHLELGAHFDRQSSQSPGGPARTFDRDLFDQRLHLDLDGHVLHPGILRFNLGGEIGSRQGNVESNTNSSGDEFGFLYGYNNRIDLFRGYPISAAIFASRADDDNSHSFATDTTSTHENVGASLHLNAPVFPSVFTWQRSQLQIDSRADFLLSRRDETRTLYEYSGSRARRNSQMRLRLRQEDVDDSSLPALGDYRVREATGLFARSWGEDDAFHFRTGGRYSNRSGRSAFENASANTSLGWDITENLDSRIDHDFTRTDSSGFVTSTNDVFFSLDHSLYESLESRATFFAQVSDREDGSRTVYGPDLNLDYRKKLPWESRLKVTTRFRYRFRDDDFQIGTLSVVGETLEITDFVGNEFENIRIDVGTVVVFDVDGSTLIEGLDYDLDLIGDRLTLLVLPGGVIELGDVLTTNYLYTIDPSAKIETLSYRIGVGWEWRWLELRYERSATEDRQTGGTSELLQDSARDAARVRIHASRGRLSASAGAVYAHDRTVSTEYDEISFTQLVNWRASDTVHVTLRAREALLDFRRPRRNTELLSGGAVIWWRPWTDQRLRLIGDLRRFRDSVGPDHQDFEVGIEIDSRFAAIEITPTFFWTRRERGGARSNDLRGGVRLRRNF